MRHLRVWFAAAPPGGPRSNPVGYYRAGSGPGPVKRESGQMSRGAPTGAVFFLFRACSARPPPHWGKGKETGSHAPDQSPGPITLASLTNDHVNGRAWPLILVRTLLLAIYPARSSWTA